jgi:hypothetical protein
MCRSPRARRVSFQVRCLAENALRLPTGMEEQQASYRSENLTHPPAQATAKSTHSTVCYALSHRRNLVPSTLVRMEENTNPDGLSKRTGWASRCWRGRCGVESRSWRCRGVGVTSSSGMMMMGTVVPHPRRCRHSLRDRRKLLAIAELTYPVRNPHSE